MSANTLCGWVLDSEMGNRDLELEHFEHFRAATTDVPSGNIKHVDAPDFLIEMTGQTLGIELTRVLKTPSSTKPRQPALDSNADDIICLALEHAKRLCTPPAFLRLFFNLRVPIQKK